MSISGTTNKSYTESLNQCERKEQSFVFMATLMKRLVQWGGHDLLERKKLNSHNTSNSAFWEVSVTICLVSLCINLHFQIALS